MIYPFIYIFSGLGNKDNFASDVRPDLVDTEGKLSDCPACAIKGEKNSNNEHHFSIQCPQLDIFRETMGLTRTTTFNDYIRDKRNEGLEDEEILRHFLGQDGASSTAELNKRGAILENLKQIFVSLWLE